MSRQQWGWIAAIGLALLFALVTGKYAYDAHALGAPTAGIVTAAMWAVPILAGLAGVIGVLGAIQASFKALVIRAVNSLAARLAIIAAGLAAGVVFLIAALAAEPPRTWTCSVTGPKLAAADASRCAPDARARMRSFQLRVVRDGDPGEPPILRAVVRDRAASSVAVDSDRGGLCAANGPDQPTRGESRLALTADCGVDRVYPVNLHLCDAAATGTTGGAAAQLAAAVRLEIRESNHASGVTCQ
jgi:hypothetical protein